MHLLLGCLSVHKTPGISLNLHPKSYPLWGTLSYKFGIRVEKRTAETVRYGVGGQVQGRIVTEGTGRLLLGRLKYCL